MSIDGTPANGNFVVALYDPSNPSSYPNSPVFQQALTSGFPGPISVTATGLQAIVYSFVLWDTSGTVPGGESRNAFSLQPTIQTLQVRASLYLIADSTPGFYSTSPTYTDPTSSLAQWAYDYEQIGYGTLNPGTGNDYTIDPTTHNPTLLAGNPNTGQKFVIHFIPIVSNQVISVTAQSLVSGYTLVTTNTTLSSSNMGQMILVKGATTQVVVTLPALSTLSAGQSIFILSSGGLHINCVINAAGSDTFQWLQYSNQATLQIQMILGQSEQILLIKDFDNQWNVMQCSSGVTMVGELLMNYTQYPINTVQTAGQLLNRADYPRLWNYVQSLSSACIANEGSGSGGWLQQSNFDDIAYYINIGKFTYGDGSTTFRIPSLCSTSSQGTVGFLRMVDGAARTPGSFQIDAMEAHRHNRPLGLLPGPDNPNGNGPSTTVGRYNGTQVSESDLSSLPVLYIADAMVVAQKVDYETRPVNVGVYGLIRI